MSRPKAPPTPDRVDEAALVTELLSARREELDQANHQLNLVRASIRSERHKWELEQGEQRRQHDLRRQAQEAQHTLALEAVGRQQREAETLREEASELRAHARQQCAELAEKAAQYADLAQQRLDTARLRLEAHDLLERAQTAMRAAQTRDNEASQKFEEAQQTLSACAKRTAELDQTYNTLKAWQDDLTRRERDCQVIQQTIDAHLKEAPHVGAGPVGNVGP